MTTYNLGQQVILLSSFMGKLINNGLLVLVTSAVTAWIASMLTSSRDQKRWILDNKKQEWRELVDTMHECFDRMADFSSEANESIQEGYRILRNRIFIADVISKERIMESWQKLVEYSQSAQLPRESHTAGGVPTPVGFNLLACPLEDKLMELVRRDLSLAKPSPRSSFHRFGSRRPTR